MVAVYASITAVSPKDFDTFLNVSSGIALSP
jgi:hypothetical protein